VGGIKVTTEASGPIDPLEHPGEVLWAVYGPPCCPTIICCKVLRGQDGYYIWGYSIYRRQAGFRTLGTEYRNWQREHNARFYLHRELALDYVRELITPKEKK
jgi:hypothetical protein